MSDPLFPVPVELLVDHVVDDGADYNDGLFGWYGGSYDPETRVLTMFFDPETFGADEHPNTPLPEFAETKYRFTLLD